MVFSSSIFLLYFLPLFLGIYFLSPQKLKNLIIVLASLFFYTWGAPLFVFVLCSSLVLDFFVAKKIASSDEVKKRAWLIFSIITSVALMLYFKYANFFIENVNQMLGSFGVKKVEWTKVALPVGISFFTFHQLSYIIDVYRGVKKPMDNIVNYGLYILFFPQLIAGPIIRFNEISDQIIDRKNQETLDNKLLGIFRFIIGLSKKVLIANSMGAVADSFFNSPIADLGTQQAWIAILAYTFQIYFDFSGYSDMAIGLARIMGFVFPENFNNPYIAESITDFWRRWHITLSRWMRDYLYIPLGGNKVSSSRMYLNLWIVFLISGFWHGASWNFVIWGTYHGLFLIFDRLFLVKATSKIGKIPRIILTFFIVVMGWVFFRIEHFDDAILFITKLFTPHSPALGIQVTQSFYVLFSAAVFFSFWAMWSAIEKFQLQFYNYLGATYQWLSFSFVAIVLLFVSIIEITSSTFNPFIYFRF